MIAYSSGLDRPHRQPLAVWLFMTLSLRKESFMTSKQLTLSLVVAAVAALMLTA